MNDIKAGPRIFATGFLILIGLLIVAIAISGYGIRFIPGTRDNTPEVVLIVLLLTGATILMLALVFIATIFVTFGLSDRAQALGLPEGSVRALIALLLLLIFAIVAIHLYWGIRKPPLTDPISMSQTQLDAIPSAQLYSVRSIGERFEVIKILTTEDSNDFAQQILTTVSTLVVAVSGFYFGTRAVAGEIAEAALVPLINKIEIKGATDPKNTWKRVATGTTILTCYITGQNFQSPSVKLSKLPDELPGAIIEWQATMITCSFTFKDPSADKEGLWDVVVVNENGHKHILNSGFVITS